MVESAQPTTILETLAKQKLKPHHPTDLVHGLLSEHCKHESLNAPAKDAKTNIRVDDKVPLTFVDRSKPGKK